MENNTDFFSQKGDLEKLKKERKKKITNNSEESPELVVVQHDNITQELTKANITDQVLRELAEYKKLTVNGLDDKEGYEKVKSAQTLCRNTRVLAEKICKKGRESAIAEQRAWIKKEKEVSEQIEEVETYLKEQREIIDGEKARQVAERENHMKTRMQERTTVLLGFGMVFDGQTFVLQEGEEKLEFVSLDIKMLDDVQFNIFQLRAEILHEKSKIRIAAEQQAAADERIRVEAIAKAQEEERIRIAAQQAEMDRQLLEIKKQQDAIEEAKREVEREKQKAIEIKAAEEAARIKAEKDKEEALAQAEVKRLKDIADLETAQRLKEEAIAKAEATKLADLKRAEEKRIAEETAAKAKAEREAALAPERVKLVLFANAVDALLQSVPELSTDPGKLARVEISAAVLKLSAYIRAKAEKLRVK